MGEHLQYLHFMSWRIFLIMKVYIFFAYILLLNTDMFLSCRILTIVSRCLYYSYMSHHQLSQSTLIHRCCPMSEPTAHNYLIWTKKLKEVPINTKPLSLPEKHLTPLKMPVHNLYMHAMELNNLLILHPPQKTKTLRVGLFTNAPSSHRGLDIFLESRDQWLRDVRQTLTLGWLTQYVSMTQLMYHFIIFLTPTLLFYE